ncbi:hypothetical protein BDZ94DRAFT_508972 [Collybia nuda]|uniref:Uncharacterized protein n=1 Tax=Collybia nuda TaxID=64659 RepID=A0A9P5YAH9_9AGAR|nr:hypothetical protein BDZ94DRAFT_508972 [Collybia nuda]
MIGSTRIWLQKYSVKPLIKFKHLVSECQFQGSSSLLLSTFTVLAHSRFTGPTFKSNYTIQNCRERCVTRRFALPENARVKPKLKRTPSDVRCAVMLRPFRTIWLAARWWGDRPPMPLAERDKIRQVEGSRSCGVAWVIVVLHLLYSTGAHQSSEL